MQRGMARRAGGTGPLRGSVAPVEREQRAVEIWTPIAEQSPRGASRSDRLQIDLGGDHRVGIPRGFGQLGARWSAMNDEP